jgi:hypothetical protein
MTEARRSKAAADRDAKLAGDWNDDERFPFLSAPEMLQQWIDAVIVEVSPLGANDGDNVEQVVKTWVDAVCRVLTLLPPPADVGEWRINMDRAETAFNNLPLAERMQTLKRCEMLAVNVPRTPAVLGSYRQFTFDPRVAKNPNWEKMEELIKRITGKSGDVWEEALGVIADMESEFFDLTLALERGGATDSVAYMKMIASTLIVQEIIEEGGRHDVWNQSYVLPVVKGVVNAKDVGRKPFTDALKIIMVFAECVHEKWMAIWTDPTRIMGDRITALKEDTAVLELLQDKFGSNDAGMVFLGQVIEEDSEEVADIRAFVANGDAAATQRATVRRE